MVRKKVTLIGMMIFVISLTTSCASIYTLTADSEDFYGGACTESCKVIPRIYSGTVMDFCGAFVGGGGQGAAIMFYDLFLSIPVDTLVLPYTIYSQFLYGNFWESKKCESDQISSEVRVKPKIAQ